MNDFTACKWCGDLLTNHTQERLTACNECLIKGLGKDIYWIDPYAKKDPKNLDSYATCVIDGYGWRVNGEGKTYCAGKVENLIKEVK